MQPHGHWVNARNLQVGDELISRSQFSLHVLGIAVRNEITTVYNLTVADYHTYAVGIYEALVHNKAMKNKLADDDFGFRPKRESQNSKMKSGHINDKPTIDAIQNKYNLSDYQMEKFHLKIAEMKSKGETLPWKELERIAKEIKNTFPNK
jgi:hypothetical protein